MQKAHHEAANRQPVRHDEHPLRRLPLDLTHHRLEKARRAIEAIGRALAAAEAVVEPAVPAPQILLLLDRLIAMFHFAEARIFEDAHRSALDFQESAAGENPIERLQRAT